jgi:hypothetical protein
VPVQLAASKAAPTPDQLRCRRRQQRWTGTESSSAPMSNPTPRPRADPSKPSPLPSRRQAGPTALSPPLITTSCARHCCRCLWLAVPKRVYEGGLRAVSAPHRPALPLALPQVRVFPRNHAAREVGPRPMATLNDKQAALFTDRNWGVIATIREDGSPQVTPGRPGRARARR